MEKLKTILWKIAYWITGNQAGQRLLDWNLHIARLLMGIGSGVYPESSGESAIARVLNSDREPGATVTIFDVGANTGQFTNVLIQRLDPPYQIHAFEPASAAFTRLEEQCGNYPGVILNNLGLDRQPNRSKLYFDEPGSLRTSKYPVNLSHIGVSLSQTQLARFDTLDNYCRAEGIRAIDLLKLDVEGNEMNVLLGARGVLGRKLIRWVSFEFGETHMASRTWFRDIYDYLSSMGMVSLQRITPSGYLVPINTYHEKLEQFFPTNYLARMK